MITKGHLHEPRQPRTEAAKEGALEGTEEELRVHSLSQALEQYKPGLLGPRGSLLYTGLRSPVRGRVSRTQTSLNPSLTGCPHPFNLQRPQGGKL